MKAARRVRSTPHLRIASEPNGVNMHQDGRGRNRHRPPAMPYWAARSALRVTRAISGRQFHRAWKALAPTPRLV